MDFRKRPRKDTLYVSKRHLRRLAAQEAANFTKNVVHESSLLNDNTKCITNVNHDRCNSRRKYREIASDIDTENENNSFVQHEQYENNILVHGDTQSASDQSALWSDSQRSSLNIIREESSDLNFDNHNGSGSYFEDNLATWAVKHHISHTALSALLLTLRKHSCFSTLFVNARTLLKTPKQQDVRIVVPGTYYHFGLLKSIRQILSSVKEDIECLKIAINIDGLPLTKSSQQQFWPILVNKIVTTTVLAYTWLNYSKWQRFHDRTLSW